MAKSLAKVTKKINKKKGQTGALHENSKHAQRLRRAGGREEKLNKVASARAKGHQPLLQRIALFQDAVAEEAENAETKFTQEQVHTLIQEYLSRDDEELAELKSQRRPGRPSSTREDLLKQRMDAEDKEYSSGFWVPDIQDNANIELLRRWKGDWGGLCTLKFVRLSRDGSIQASKFPPKGQS